MDSARQGGICAYRLVWLNIFLHSLCQITLETGSVNPDKAYNGMTFTFSGCPKSSTFPRDGSAQIVCRNKK
jgi:hypothetical protein